MLGILWCKPQCGQDWRGEAGRCKARRGCARPWLQTAALRAQALPAALFGEGRHGWFRSGEVGSVREWLGAIGQGNSCRRQHGALKEALCCSFKRVDMVGCCTVGQGEAVRGNSCRQQQGGSRLSLLLSTEGRPGAACLGAACCGRVRQSPARCGYSCRRQHRGFRAPLLFSLESRLGRVRCG
jgi:hypothetical protein